MQASDKIKGCLFYILLYFDLPHDFPGFGYNMSIRFCFIAAS